MVLQNAKPVIGVPLVVSGRDEIQRHEVIALTPGVTMLCHALFSSGQKSCHLLCCLLSCALMTWPSSNAGDSPI